MADDAAVDRLLQSVHEVANLAGDAPPDTPLDDLRLRVTLWIAKHDGEEGAHREAVHMLDTWHAGHGTRGGEAIAKRQALLLFFLADGDTVQQAAARIPCSLSTAKRDVAALEDIFGVPLRGSGR